MKPKAELIKHMKKRRKLSTFLPSLKAIFSGKSIFIIIFLLLFTLSVILFTRFELRPYFESLYWLVTTAATVGYGDITPETLQGRILALVVMVLGVSLLGFLLSPVNKKNCQLKHW